MTAGLQTQCVRSPKWSPMPQPGLIHAVLELPHAVVCPGLSCPDYARVTEARESFISPHAECGSTEMTEMTKSTEKMKRFSEKSKHKEKDFPARERLPLFQTVICKLTLHTTL